MSIGNVGTGIDFPGTLDYSTLLSYWYLHTAYHDEMSTSHDPRARVQPTRISTPTIATDVDYRQSRAPERVATTRWKETRSINEPFHDKSNVQRTRVVCSGIFFTCVYLPKVKTDNLESISPPWLFPVLENPGM